MKRPRVRNQASPNRIGLFFTGLRQGEDQHQKGKDFLGDKVPLVDRCLPDD